MSQFLPPHTLRRLTLSYSSLEYAVRICNTTTFSNVTHLYVGNMMSQLSGLQVFAYFTSLTHLAYDEGQEGAPSVAQQRLQSVLEELPASANDNLQIIIITTLNPSIKSMFDDPRVVVVEWFDLFPALLKRNGNAHSNNGISTALRSMAVGQHYGESDLWTYGMEMLQHQTAERKVRVE